MHHFRTELRKFEDNLWTYHFLVPQELVDSLTADGNKRVICTLNDHEAFHAGLMPDGKGNTFIKLNKQRMKEFALHVGQPLDICLEKDESKYGMFMPEEFEELLYQDPEGEAYFEALTPGKKRSLIYIVDKVKSENIRLRKALVILQHLKQNRGTLDFRQLNEDLKNSNQDLDSFFR